MSFQEWNTAGSYSYTVPHGVKSITIYLIGAGSDGESAANGHGGAGGGYIRKVLSVSPGDVIGFTVGAHAAYTSASGDTNWNGVFIATGASGNTPGTHSGSGTPDTSSDGGLGGVGTTCCQTICDATDPDTGDCISSHDECSDYRGGGGSSGTESGPANGGDAACTGGSSGTDGAGGTAPASPGGNGGDPGHAAGNGGGGASGGNSGGDGFVRVQWTPGHLAFTTEPSNAEASVNISPDIVVQAQFSDNTADTSFTGSITLTISTNPGGSTITGTNPVSALGGNSNFTISLNNVATGYILTASATDFDDGTSTSFNILVPAVNLAMAAMEVEVALVNPPITTTGPPVNLAMAVMEVQVNLVNPPPTAGATIALQPQRIQVNEVASSLTAGASLALVPQRVQVNEVAPSLTAGAALSLSALNVQVNEVASLPAAGAVVTIQPLQVLAALVNTQPVFIVVNVIPSVNDMKYWFNGLPFQGVNENNKPLKYWRSGLPSQPLRDSPAATLALPAMQVQVNLVMPPQLAGAALPLPAMQQEVREIPLTQVGGVNVLIAPMQVISTVNSKPTSDCTIALAPMHVEVRSNIQATTGGGSITINPLRVEANLPAKVVTGDAIVSISLPIQVNLLRETPLAGAVAPIFAMEVEAEYAASVTGGASVNLPPISQIVELADPQPVLIPQVLLSLQETDLEEFPVETVFPVSLGLSLQETEQDEYTPSLRTIFTVPGGDFAEITRSSSSMIIFGSDPGQPFKLNPSATTYRRLGPSHIIHLGEVKPKVVTVDALFDIITPVFQLEVNEFNYQAPGGFLRIYNSILIQASLIQDGDTDAIPLTVVLSSASFGQIASTTIAQKRKT